MKKILLFYILSIISMTVCSQQITHVSGCLTDVGDSLLYNLYDMNLENPRSMGKLAVRNGKFDFDLPLKHVSLLLLMNLESVKNDLISSKTASVVIRPGEDLVINGTLDDFGINGSAFYLECEETNRIMQKYMNMQLHPEAGDIRGMAAKEGMEYIKKHPDQEASVTLMQFFNLSQLEQAVNMLSTRVREGKMKEFYEPLIKAQKQMTAIMEASNKIKPGMEAPDFTLQDINGKSLSLSSLRGKYVILDFWGSWCGWCIKGFPDMKKYYEKYRAKMEIVGVDCNDTKEKWKASVEKHQLPWKHVFHGAEDKVLIDYAVSGFPTKVIIDPEGKIVNVSVGEDPAFYEFIDSLFK